ncbi:hypothetical protein ACEPAI_2815 [Sanghuangporus weigelae]
MSAASCGPPFRAVVLLTYSFHTSASLHLSITSLTHPISGGFFIHSAPIVGRTLVAPSETHTTHYTGDKRFTEDWALVELNRRKFDWNFFRGNVINLGAKLMAGQFMKKMYPHAETHAKFKYPHGGLTQLRDFVKDGKLPRPTMLDANGEQCLIVVKNSATTTVTLGRATGIESHQDSAFSAPGDSGSIVVDANSRIVGMLTGGAGQTNSTDVTYVSPYYFLDERIKKAFPNSYLYPIPDPTPA